MSKTLASLKSEYAEKLYMWTQIADDPQALEDRNKTQKEALIIASYFEGKYDGVVEAGYLKN